VKAFLITSTSWLVILGCITIPYNKTRLLQTFVKKLDTMTDCTILIQVDYQDGSSILTPLLVLFKE